MSNRIDKVKQPNITESNQSSRLDVKILSKKIPEAKPQTTTDIGAINFLQANRKNDKNRLLEEKGFFTAKKSSEIDSSKADLVVDSLKKILKDDNQSDRDIEFALKHYLKQDELLSLEAHLEKKTNDPEKSPDNFDNILREKILEFVTQDLNRKDYDLSRQALFILENPKSPFDSNTSVGFLLSVNKFRKDPIGVFNKERQERQERLSEAEKIDSQIEKIKKTLEPLQAKLSAVQELNKPKQDEAKVTQLSSSDNDPSLSNAVYEALSQGWKYFTQNKTLKSSGSEESSSTQPTATDETSISTEISANSITKNDANSKIPSEISFPTPTKK